MPVAVRLAGHYQREDRKEDVDRVIRICGAAVERISAVASGMLGQAWLSDLYKTYKEYGLTDDADRVLLASKEKGREAESELVPITASARIDREEFDAFLEQMSDGGIEASLARMAGAFLPQIAQITQDADALRKKYPLQSMFTKVKLGEHHIVAKVGSAESDPEGNLISDIAQRLCLSAPLLNGLIEHLKEKYSFCVEHAIAYCQLSPAFDERSLAMVREGLTAYFHDDLVKAIHILVPQIENALRQVLAQIGRPTNKPRRGDVTWMVEKSMNDMLEHEPELKLCLGDDVVMYLLSFLADPRGNNLRNRLSHGLLPIEAFSRPIADRVFHILLLLGSMRPRPTTEEEPTSENK